MLLSIQQAAPGAFQVLDDCDDVRHDAELLLLLTPRECHTRFRTKGLLASNLRAQKHRHLRKAAPSPNMTVGCTALLCPGFFFYPPPGWAVFPRQGSRPLHSPWHGAREKGKGPNEVLFSKDEVTIQGQLAWMPPSGLPGKYSLPKALHKRIC